MFLAIYLEFAKLSERNFGGIAVGKAASEVTTNFCRSRGVPKKCVCQPSKLLQIFAARTLRSFLCLLLLKGFICFFLQITIRPDLRKQQKSPKAALKLPLMICPSLYGSK